MIRRLLPELFGKSAFSGWPPIQRRQSFLRVVPLLCSHNSNSLSALFFFLPAASIHRSVVWKAIINRTISTKLTSTFQSSLPRLSGRRFVYILIVYLPFPTRLPTKRSPDREWVTLHPAISYAPYTPSPASAASYERIIFHFVNIKRSPILILLFFLC